MASTSADDLRRNLGWLFGAGSTAGLTDGELLQHFAHRRDEAAEAAFETWVAGQRRKGVPRSDKRFTEKWEAGQGWLRRSSKVEKSTSDV